LEAIWGAYRERISADLNPSNLPSV
jgi:hypothetical protein